ncbi:MAG: response regulator transcription factor [Muribaculaceae bacterium]|nr:response regulator transcription factor [Bacteroides sp.]MDE6842975.1 response regulator transcription factor [Muribaculaceae bacterium]MDE7189881.1 response regulator transcription factor [Muribaculaceae bacterium]
MKSVKILLVDDDLKNSMLLKRFIEAEGYDVTYANNGRIGLELYREIHPNLILLDINMPEIDGFELARIIRQTDKRVIIFFLTDRTDKVDRLHGFSLKGNDYIPKPFYPEELIAKINERLESLTVSQDTVYLLGATIFRPNISTLTYNGETHSLSLRQTEILQLLAENLGHPVERNRILEQVWGDASYSNSLALNVQITYIRRLLADPSLTITSIKKKGYLLSVL